ncbi:MAG: uracil-DNA glycosylase family protein, partial [Brevinema sp.]
FLPADAKTLLLGSFPPAIEKWRMNFYYPNFQNDMWRILGEVFFDDKNYFLLDQDHFDQHKIEQFLIEQKIAVADAIKKTSRLENNASDNNLQVAEYLNFHEVLKKIPYCQRIVATGGLASDIICSYFRIKKIKKTGESASINIDGKNIVIIRAPSSSRRNVNTAGKYKAYVQIFKNSSN